ncbi:MAG: phosphatidylserine decarboxylase family protein [Planctomycetota bacterium]|nr:phosphatidylserine decarboxylase family protein [Planctomycetota bacterium]
MRGILRKLGFAEYGGDELFLATLACGALAWALAVLLHPAAAAVAFAPYAIVLWFFRDPERTVPTDPQLLISPADGTVTDIVEVDEPGFLNTKAVRVGIFLSPFNVHVNRVPCDGMVAHLKYRAGEFLPAYNPKAPERNESFELGLLTLFGDRVMVKQITGVLARRIVCAAKLGDHFARGQRYGMIKFGSRTELYVPADGGFGVNVKVGEKVVGGETVLVRRVRAPQAAAEPAAAGAVVSQA